MQEITYPYRYQIDTREAVSESNFIVKWFAIKKIDTIKLVIRHERYSEVDNTIYLFGRTEDCSKKGAQIFVYLYDLTTAQKFYEERIGFYLDQKQNFRLINKQNFGKEILQSKNIDETIFTHDAFQTKDGRFRKRIVHSYQSNEKAIIIVYSLDDNSLTENSFFNFFAENSYAD